LGRRHRWVEIPKVRESSFLKPKKKHIKEKKKKRKKKGTDGYTMQYKIHNSSDESEFAVIRN
jgi:hypothetical protein